MSLTSDAARLMAAASCAAYPEEAVGLLLGSWRASGEIAVGRAVVLPNGAAAEVRRTRYAIAPRLLLEWGRVAERGGLSIVGFFHSHPDQPPVPSATDAALAWPDYAYVIASTGRATPSSAPMVTGTAAWTFDEAAARFEEVGVRVEVADDEIEFYI